MPYRIIRSLRDRGFWRALAGNRVGLFFLPHFQIADSQLLIDARVRPHRG